MISSLFSLFILYLRQRNYRFHVLGVGEHVDGLDDVYFIAVREKMAQVAHLRFGVATDVYDACGGECARSL